MGKVVASGYGGGDCCHYGFSSCSGGLVSSSGSLCCVLSPERERVGEMMRVEGDDDEEWMKRAMDDLLRERPACRASYWS